MTSSPIDLLQSELRTISVARRAGRITEIRGGTIEIGGLSDVARLGDLLEISRPDGHIQRGEVIALSKDRLVALTDGAATGLSIGNRVFVRPDGGLAPDDSWIGRIVDAFGAPLDGRRLAQGRNQRSLLAPAPPAARRRPLGARLETGFRAFNTLLPIVRGQRVGLFAGSGVGKSTLLADLARGVAADVVVIGMIGERGREVRHFAETVLGPEGLARSVIVAATSDQSALARRRAALSTMTVAEHFRDQGKQVLVLFDSVTRFAEAHREVALAGGEPASMRGYPPSVAQMIMGLAERAGPGIEGGGDITAVFSVLVAGSDMEEPIADILRGVLDGHVVLDREIAERGRYPAINLLRSVSRSLPAAASEAENQLIAQARRMLGVYDRAEMMIQSGLYTNGSNTEIDQAIALWPGLDAFLAEGEEAGTAESFQALSRCLGQDPFTP